MSFKIQIIQCLLALFIISLTSCEKRVDNLLEYQQKTNKKGNDNLRLEDSQFVLLIEKELSTNEILDLVNKFYVSDNYVSLFEDKFSTNITFIYNETINSFENYYDNELFNSSVMETYLSGDINNHLVTTININDKSCRRVVVLIDIGGVTMVIGFSC